ncbi:tetratricopeptide repeat protein [Bacteroides cellulosilyticus]|jgi:tetratricopeptide (TPR) repeat protein|uniref:Amino acid ABC transporter permease n=2 Tax=Bacteroides cellulosilyticus TaxID=246787 RepID=A0A120A540_9BACE|nr:amino acid ABC transporter permease [Bacteroides cellulosilyticus]KAA5415289.1 amino acid ABC transporter permease [Bacteroides cellulosilyticus]KWR59308.1 tetratricopeptide repeat protein [Bacteroides cellulosilyticus]MBX9084397.1 amino acid ABC transporter permease [Bacteroides cellulosilyticus]MCB6590653.1 amino acid ABC transporter permease [Bacteroides cellulosilyticus]QUT88916.1 Tetratricopeptide repeat protein [Bacteroides cellulosilyticus]
MKLTERLILLFIIQLCFWACDNKPYSHLMSMADSLTNTNPDSAVIYLNKLKDHIETAPRSVQMYYQLLCIKANDRAYIPHSSDSIILPILNYYKQTDDLHLPETYYYAGRIYRDLGDAPQALDYFNNTLDALPSSSDSYSLKSKVYSQIGTLFLYQDIYDEALKMFKEAFHYDLLLEDSVGMSYDLRDMATSYRCLNQIDSAIYYYGKANDLALALHQQRFVSMIQSQMAGLYIQLKKYDLAKQFLQSSLSYQHKADKSGIFSVAAKYYHQLGTKDSAVYYYTQLLDFGTIYAKQAAHWGLAELAIDNNHEQDAIPHLRAYMQCVDSIRKITDREAIRQMRSVYNYKLREKEIAHLKSKNEQTKLIIISLLSLCAILASITFAYIQYFKLKQLQLTIRLKKIKRLKDKLYSRSVQFIEENKRKIEELEIMERKFLEVDQINTTLKEQLNAQKELIIYTNKQIKLDLNRREQSQAVLFKSEIYLHIQRQLKINDRSKRMLSDEDWKELEKLVNSTYNGFKENLYDIYNLSLFEYRVCLLIKINIQPIDIGKLTEHSKESISSTRRRLYEKVFHIKGAPKDWDDFIYSL